MFCCCCYLYTVIAKNCVLFGKQVAYHTLQNVCVTKFSGCLMEHYLTRMQLVSCDVSCSDSALGHKQLGHSFSLIAFIE